VTATVATAESLRRAVSTSLDDLYKGAKTLAADPQPVPNLGERALVDSQFPGLLTVRFPDAVINVRAAREVKATRCRWKGPSPTNSNSA
jgi:hypothetical protein